MFKHLVVLILSLTSFVLPANSQSRIAPANELRAQSLVPGHEPVSDRPSNDRPSIDPQKQLEQTMITRVIAQRHAQLRLDTDKLVALTAELKQHVDQAGANILSMDVIKKAQEIQKLAKSVQDKMKNAY
jgi:hypothetical protein